MAKAAEAADEFLDIEDLAELLKKPVATIYKWRSVGYGPPGAKIGKSILWRRRDVLAWYEKQVAADASATV